MKERKNALSRMLDSYVSNVKDTATFGLEGFMIMVAVHMLAAAMLVGLSIAFCRNLALGACLAFIFIVPVAVVSYIASLPDSDDD